jgi:hypothetical protein
MMQIGAKKVVPNVVSTASNHQGRTCHQEMLMGLYSFNPTVTFLERNDLNSGYNSNISSLPCKLFALT